MRRASRANACAAPCASRSIFRRSGPGTITAAPAGIAHGAAYATYVGTWRKRFRITAGEARHHALRGQAGRRGAQLLPALRHAADLRARPLAPHDQHPARAVCEPHRPPAALSHRHRRAAGVDLHAASRSCRSRDIRASCGSARERRSDPTEPRRSRLELWRCDGRTIVSGGRIAGMRLQALSSFSSKRQDWPLASSITNCPRSKRQATGAKRVTSWSQPGFSVSAKRPHRRRCCRD